MLGSLLKGVFDIAGSIVSATGSIIGLSISTVAKSLDITEEMVIKAKDAGCETFEEIKNFWDIDK